MKKNGLTIFVSLFVLASLTGCGGDPKVSGKVTFTDGSPLTVGKVMFQKERFSATCDIQPNGTYSAGKIKDGDGLPPGRYRVFIADAFISEEGKAVIDSNGASFVPEIRKELIASKYTSPETSELTVEVKGNTTFNITVEAP